MIHTRSLLGLGAAIALASLVYPEIASAQQGAAPATQPTTPIRALTCAVDMACTWVVVKALPCVVLRLLISAAVSPAIAEVLSAGMPVVLVKAATFVVESAAT